MDKLTIPRPFGRSHCVVAADSKGFFDNSQPDGLSRMVAERLEDGAWLRLSRQGLKAGGLDTDGPVLHPVTGTAPGGGIAPLLAHVDLPYALDRGCENVGTPRGGGEAGRLRDADELGAAVPSQEEAERFAPARGARLGQVGLEGAPAKTRVRPVPHHHNRGRTSVDVLGFEGRWGSDRAGKPQLKRRPARQKLRNSMKRCTAWCRDTCRSRVREVCRDLHVQRRGDDRSDGVHGHSPSRPQGFPPAMRRLCKGRKRRRPRRRDTWTGFTELLRHLRVERPRLIGRPTPPRVALEA